MYKKVKFKKVFPAEFDFHGQIIGLKFDTPRGGLKLTKFNFHVRHFGFIFVKVALVWSLVVLPAWCKCAWAVVNLNHLS